MNNQEDDVVVAGTGSCGEVPSSSMAVTSPPPLCPALPSISDGATVSVSVSASIGHIAQQHTAHTHGGSTSKSPTVPLSHLEHPARPMTTTNTGAGADVSPVSRLVCELVARDDTIMSDTNTVLTLCTTTFGSQLVTASGIEIAQDDACDAPVCIPTPSGETVSAFSASTPDLTALNNPGSDVASSSAQCSNSHTPVVIDGTCSKHLTPQDSRNMFVRRGQVSILRHFRVFAEILIRFSASSRQSFDSSVCISQPAEQIICSHPHYSRTRWVASRL
jgi:hypothetical protein